MPDPIQKCPAGDPQAHEELILQCLPRVRCIALRLSNKLPPNVELDDLVSEGIFGLMAAMQRFDPSRGARFNTYAELRIRWAMLDSLRRLDWVPRSVRAKCRTLERAAKKLEQRFGRAPDETEVAEHLGISVSRYRRLSCARQRMSVESLPDDGFEPGGDARPLQIPEVGGDESFLRIQQEEQRRILAAAIDRLPRRERLVVTLHYFDGMSMKEIGSVMGFDDSRASQYHSRAKAKLLARFRRLSLRRESL